MLSLPPITSIILARFPLIVCILEHIQRMFYFTFLFASQSGPTFGIKRRVERERDSRIEAYTSVVEW
jgi:hypothetical protein